MRVSHPLLEWEGGQAPVKWTEGQYVCINSHNQFAWYPPIYTEDKKMRPFSQHKTGIRWKILAIMWSTQSNLIAKTAGDTLVS